MLSEQQIDNLSRARRVMYVVVRCDVRGWRCAFSVPLTRRPRSCMQTHTTYTQCIYTYIYYSYYYQE